MVGSTCFAGVAMLTLMAPFEVTAPLLRLPQQSVSNLELAVVVAFVCAAAALLATRRVPEWRTPLTQPWLALLAAMAVASLLSPVSRANALHMTGRLAAAFGIFLLAGAGLTTAARLRAALTLAVAVGVVVAVLAILEYRGVRPVLALLEAFRPGVSAVGAQLRAGGPLQYPTVASMYLEVVFAAGLGVMLAAHDARRRARVAILFAALVVIAEAITLTFTRAGLITIVASLLVVGGLRRLRDRRAGGTALIAALAAVVVLLVAGSRSAQSLWLRLTSEGQDAWYSAAIVAPQRVELPTGSRSAIPITVTNTGRLVWDSDATPPMLLSYHWRLAGGDRFVTFEGERTAFVEPVRPGATVTLAVNVRAPRHAGDYRLEWDLVQEGRLWFSTEPGAEPAISRATITGEPYTGPIVTTAPPRRTLRPGRLVLWRAAARMVAAHPITGIGPDNFRLAYGTYAGLSGVDVRMHSNNMYLEMLAGGGLLVGCAFGWLVWRAAGCAAALARCTERHCAIAFGLAAALLAIALHATVDSFLSFAPTYVLFSLTLGSAVACARGVESHAHRL